jgi:8-oxo-dGTP diphosphatase
VLAAQRSLSMSLPLKWEFPGGKKNDNESDRECLQRGILEELNLLVTVKEKFIGCEYDYAHISILLRAYIMEYECGTVLLIEHNRYSWVSRLEIEKLDWAEADLRSYNIC